MNLSIVTAKARCLEEADLCAWLGDALPGDQLIYHRGFLAMDCNPATSRLPKLERTGLGLVARRARIAQDLGLARLLQRRHGDGDYSYIIVACSRRLPPCTPATRHTSPPTSRIPQEQRHDQFVCA